MGAGETKPVLLCLHSVHNVQHSVNESYYGMATNNSAEGDIPVTSERPAKLTTGLDTVLTVRIFLHERGAPSTSDRLVGLVSIPIQEMSNWCGFGLYQTWFLLENPSGNSHNMADPSNRSRIVERFRHALYGVQQELHTPRICLSLLETLAEPAEWLKDEKEKIARYESLLVSHQQHTQVTQAYFDHIEGAIDFAERSRSSKASTEAAPVEAAILRRELERVRQDQELDDLQAEHRQVTADANRRIKKDNETIVRLKSLLRELRDVELPTLRQQFSSAEKATQEMRQKNAALKKVVEEGLPDKSEEEEMTQLKRDVEVLKKQKDALMTMVQEIYGNAAREQASSDASSEQAAKLRDIRQSIGVVRGGALSNESFNMLPDPSEFLGGCESLGPNCFRRQ